MSESGSGGDYFFIPSSPSTGTLLNDHSQAFRCVEQIQAETTVDHVNHKEVLNHIGLVQFILIPHLEKLYRVQCAIPIPFCLY